jgi:hypothetical protein
MTDSLHFVSPPSNRPQTLASERAAAAASSASSASSSADQAIGDLRAQLEALHRAECDRLRADAAQATQTAQAAIEAAAAEAETRALAAAAEARAEAAAAHARATQRQTEQHAAALDALIQRHADEVGIEDLGSCV